LAIPNRRDALRSYRRRGRLWCPRATLLMHEPDSWHGMNRVVLMHEHANPCGIVTTVNN